MIGLGAAGGATASAPPRAALLWGVHALKLTLLTVAGLIGLRLVGRLLGHLGRVWRAMRAREIAARAGLPEGLSPGRAMLMAYAAHATGAITLQERDLLVASVLGS